MIGLKVISITSPLRGSRSFRLAPSAVSISSVPSSPQTQTYSSSRISHTESCVASSPTAGQGEYRLVPRWRYREPTVTATGTRWQMSTERKLSWTRIWLHRETPGNWSVMLCEQGVRGLTSVAGSLAAAEQLVEPGQSVVAGFQPPQPSPRLLIATTALGYNSIT